MLQNPVTDLCNGPARSSTKPAGALCDFNYHEESSGTGNIRRYFDADGNLVLVAGEIHVTVLHRNVDTGLTLTESVHYSFRHDFVTGKETFTGQSWHLRNEDGRLVLTGAGLLGVDLTTGEIFKETPHERTDFAATNCTALGGAPVS